MLEIDPQLFAVRLSFTASEIQQLIAAEFAVEPLRKGGSLSRQRAVSLR